MDDSPGDWPASASDATEGSAPGSGDAPVVVRRCTGGILWNRKSRALCLPLDDGSQARLRLDHDAIRSLVIALDRIDDPVIVFAYVGAVRRSEDDARRAYINCFRFRLDDDVDGINDYIENVLRETNGRIGPRYWENLWLVKAVSFSEALEQYVFDEDHDALSCLTRVEVVEPCWPREEPIWSMEQLRTMLRTFVDTVKTLNPDELPDALSIAKAGLPIRETPAAPAAEASECDMSRERL